MLLQYTADVIDGYTVIRGILDIADGSHQQVFYGFVLTAHFVKYVESVVANDGKFVCPRLYGFGPRIAGGQSLLTLSGIRLLAKEHAEVSVLAGRHQCHHLIVHLK